MHEYAAFPHENAREEADPLRSAPAAPPAGLYALLQTASLGYKSFLALRAALDVGLFAHLKEPQDADELAEKLGLDSRILSPLCGLLTQWGLLAEEDGRLRTSDEARTWLAPASPLRQQPVAENMGETFRLWERLDSALTQGPFDPQRAGIFGGAFLPALAAEALTGEVQRTADLVAAAPGFEDLRDLIDLGGGHGLYSLALCARSRELRAVILDMEGVRNMAEGNIARFGDGRVRFTAGDIRSAPLGRERDAALLFYNPGGKRADLLERIRACLRPGGLFVSKHVFYARDEGSKSPLADLEWNLTSFPGVHKQANVYRFDGDLCAEEYLALMERHFEILADHGPEAFAAPDLGKFGDRLDSRLIVARRR